MVDFRLAEIHAGVVLEVRWESARGLDLLHWALRRMVRLFVLGVVLPCMGLNLLSDLSRELASFLSLILKTPYLPLQSKTEFRLVRWPNQPMTRL